MRKHIFLFNMESSPRGIKASRKGVWWMLSFYLNRIFWLKPYNTKLYGNGFFLSMLSSKHFQTNSSGVPSLWVTAIHFVFNMSFIAIHLFEVTKLQFHTGWLLGVHGSNCCIPLRSFLLPSPKLRWHPRTSGSYYFTGGKLHFGEQLFDFKTEGAVKKRWKNPTFPPIVRIIWELLLW